jgi:hypothetical protein
MYYFLIKTFLTALIISSASGTWTQIWRSMYC